MKENMCVLHYTRISANMMLWTLNYSSRVSQWVDGDIAKPTSTYIIQPIKKKIQKFPAWPHQTCFSFCTLTRRTFRDRFYGFWGFFVAPRHIFDLFIPSELAQGLRGRSNLSIPETAGHQANHQRGLCLQRLSSGMRLNQLLDLFLKHRFIGKLTLI